MRKLLTPALLLAVSSASFAEFDANVFVPQSSIEHSWDVGVNAHTHHLLYVGPEFYPGGDVPLLAELGITHGPAAFSSGPSGFHPSDLQRAYGDPGTGSGVIAIVDAYNYPNALADFNTFASQFSLPKETSSTVTATGNKVFQVVYASGAKPANDGGWSQEMALDIEWAHAMAPNAKIVLVEAASSSLNDLMKAVDVASGLTGVTQVTMSWGSSEFSSETSFDSHFTHAGISYFASSGDSGGILSYPALSPYVVSVGGTSLSMTNGVRSETGWSGSGGGQSAYEHVPTFQSVIASLAGTHRSGPDVAAVANPNTGVSVYDSYSYQGFVGWFVVGGTSLSSPVCAALANVGAAKRGQNELSYLYAHSSGFNDITSGSAGGHSARAGWDFVTGWGSPKAGSSL